MASLNKVFLIGNLGSDPELRYTQSQRAVATLRVATNKKWRDDQGKDHEKVEWHSCVVWEKTAENCAKYLQKGSQVHVEGELSTREWEDKQGVKRWTTEIVNCQVTFLSVSKDQGARAPNGAQRPAQPRQAEPAGAAYGGPPAPGLDDIPF